MLYNPSKVSLTQTSCLNSYIKTRFPQHFKYWVKNIFFYWKKIVAGKQSGILSFTRKVSNWVHVRIFQIKDVQTKNTPLLYQTFHPLLHHTLPPPPPSNNTAPPLPSNTTPPTTPLPSISTLPLLYEYLAFCAMIYPD